MKERSSLTPINYAHWESDRIHADLSLPKWVDINKIGLDIRKTEFLMQLGGIKSIRIRSTDDEAETTYSATIVGINRDGTANVGKIKSKSVPFFESSSIPNENYKSFRNAEWIDMNIGLNIVAIADAVASGKGSAREVENWTPHVDRAIKTSVRNEGMKHLLTDFDKFKQFGLFLVNIEGTLLDAADVGIIDLVMGKLNPHIPVTEELLSEIIYTAISWTVIESIFHGPERSGRGYRASLFPGFEIDRAAILQILSRVQKIVKGIK